MDFSSFVSYLPKLIATRIQKSYLSSQQKRPIPGLPGKLDFDRIAGVCENYMNTSLVDMSYVHLSSWKQSGTFRLYLRTDQQRVKSLIYKQSDYDFSQIPALRDLPFQPGRPEYSVYKSKNINLQKYLPQVYLAEETIPRKQYHYLLEDLDEEYTKCSCSAHNLRTIAELKSLRQTLSDWLDHEDHQTWLIYDYETVNTICDYIYTKLSKYFQVTKNPLTKEVCKYISGMQDILISKSPFEKQKIFPIHGDLNPTNVFIHRNNPEKIKFVDWEWAGYGLPQADLAALLKFATEGNKVQALEQFTVIESSLSLAEHSQIYQYCCLHRSLLDAAFLASQMLESHSPTAINLTKHINAALKKSLQAYQAYQDNYIQ